MRFLVRVARAENRDLPRLSEVLNDCPEGYRLHSVVPHASGGGYTVHFNVIFESTAALTAPVRCIPRNLPDWKQDQSETSRLPPQ